MSLLKVPPGVCLVKEFTLGAVALLMDRKSHHATDVSAVSFLALPLNSSKTVHLVTQS